MFGLNTGKYGPEKTPHLDIFHPVFDGLFQWFLALLENTRKQKNKAGHHSQGRIQNAANYLRWRMLR